MNSELSDKDVRYRALSTFDIARSFVIHAIPIHQHPIKRARSSLILPSRSSHRAWLTVDRADILKIGQLTVYHLLGVIVGMSPIVSLFLSRIIKTMLEIEIRSLYMNEYMIYIQVFNIQIFQHLKSTISTVVRAWYKHMHIYMYRQVSNIHTNRRTLVGN